MAAHSYAGIKSMNIYCEPLKWNINSTWVIPQKKWTEFFRAFECSIDWVCCEGVLSEWLSEFLFITANIFRTFIHLLLFELLFFLIRGVSLQFRGGTHLYVHSGQERQFWLDPAQRRYTGHQIHPKHRAQCWPQRRKTRYVQQGLITNTCSFWYNVNRFWECCWV